MKGYLFAVVAACVAIALPFAAPSQSKACDYEFGLQLNSGFNDSYGVCDVGALGLGAGSYSLRLNQVGYGSLGLRARLERERRGRLEREILAEKLRAERLRQDRLRFQQNRHRFEFRDRPSLDLRFRRGPFGFRRFGRLRIN